MRKKTVLASGAFDILHPGHVKFLEEAKRAGGKSSKLIVIVARNKTIKENKGRDAIFSEKARLSMVQALKPVDKAVLGHRPFSFEKVVKKYKPDIVVFGYDQNWLMERFKELCRRKGWNIKVKVLKKYNLGSLNSSSDVIKKIKKLQIIKRKSG
ncbi:MAG: adenylyltransferase/cytidyltransferase family protein [Nitrososphaerota archaeon]|nr:adenylyltransferase/cytidyltransferase family protein [Aigarchaeota archaeon]MDW8076562.1 adenylyltransferase/cytidyltransferase family protein [Nitrososphaerota archaeon]